MKPLFKNINFFRVLLSVILIIIVLLLAYTLFGLRAKSQNNKVSYEYIIDGKLQFKDNTWKGEPNKKLKAFIIKDDKIVKTYTINTDSNGFRKTPDVKNSKKLPIIFFGCAYTFGKGLEDQETLPWVVSELTGRKTYNVAFGAMGPQNMLMYLRNPSFYKKIPKAGVIIYNFVPYRLNSIRNKEIGSIVLKNDKLVFNPPKVEEGYEKQGLDETLDIFLRILKESQNLALKHYPNSKFVMLVYGENPSPFFLKKVNDLGIETVDVEKLLGENFFQPKFLLPGETHRYPNAYVWEEVAPFLVYRLDL